MERAERRIDPDKKITEIVQGASALERFRGVAEKDINKALENARFRTKPPYSDANATKVKEMVLNIRICLRNGSDKDNIDPLKTFGEKLKNTMSGALTSLLSSRDGFTVQCDSEKVAHCLQLAQQAGFSIVKISLDAAKPNATFHPAIQIQGRGLAASMNEIFSLVRPGQELCALLFDEHGGRLFFITKKKAEEGMRRPQAEEGGVSA